MINSEQLNQLLKRALSSTVEPNEDLNQKIINQLKENDTMKPVSKKRISVALTAAAIFLAISITAVAAWQFLDPSQVAEKFGDHTLSQAFEDKNAIKINESVNSGGYTFTLLGILSGEGLSDFGGSAEDRHPDRTYAVVSIAKQDGSKMPDVQDEDYRQTRFFISPLIKGQIPWRVNIASMGGGYSETVVDGVTYRLIECDGIEMFADRGLYLCIITSSLYDVNAFNYDEETGEISPNPDYNGVNILFDLPLDVKKADHDKAEKYLQELYGGSENPDDNEMSDFNWEKAAAEVLENGVVIPESVKEVTYDADGLACYEYDGGSDKVRVDNLFEEGQTSAIVSMSETWMSESSGERTIVQFLKDADGVITGRAIKMKIEESEFRRKRLNSF